MVNPQWKCAQCKNPVCFSCNNEDAAQAREEGLFGTNLIGHSGSSCLEQDEDEAARNWLSV